MTVKNLLSPLSGVRQFSLLRQRPFSRFLLANAIGTTGAVALVPRIVWCSCLSRRRRFRISMPTPFVHRRLMTPTDC